MAWSLVLEARAQKELRALDRPVRERILRYLEEKLARLDDPRTVGKALAGEKLGGFWRYRVGDYRIIARIEHEQLVVTVVRVGHRREIYR